jgi:hypothetical protein
MLIDPPPSINKFKYQSWYLTPCCGFEVQKPTQALKSVKGSADTYDLIFKWARTLAVENFAWDINRTPPPSSPKKQFKYLSWYLTHCSGLEMQTLTKTLKSVKGPWSTFDLIPKWERTLSFEIFHGVFIESPLPPQKKFNIKFDI